VSVDADPTTAGIQSMFTVSQGNSFNVDVVVTGVEAAALLNAFEFALDFEGSALTAASVASGGFLLPPTLPFSTIGSSSVAFAEATLLANGALGDGVLASISFNAIAPGFSLLDLKNVILSEPFGIFISTGGITDAEITVVEAPVPSPGVLALVLSGFVALTITRRRWIRFK
jgi:hypothetical protein